MIDFLKRLFSDEQGQPSSPRTIGTLLCIAGIVAVFAGFEKSAAGLLTAGVGALAAGQAKSGYVLGATTPTAQTATSAPIPATPTAVDIAANEKPPQVKT